MTGVFAAAAALCLLVFLAVLFRLMWRVAEPNEALVVSGLRSHNEDDVEESLGFKKQLWVNDKAYLMDIRQGGYVFKLQTPLFVNIEEGRIRGQVKHAIDGMVELLEGKPNDLKDIVLDLEGVPQFNRGVYDIARTIPPGKTMTYGDIARQLGGLELSRDVGQALGRNPCPIVVPCHRVLAAGDKPGGFSANGGVATKLKMLAIEGAMVNHTPNLFD